ncbi:MAG: helix-turn-helix transcriptional regulator [Clostridium sp.]|nr:helix-turn-helix transcriptional regulator [Clostridium sp.]
MIKVKLQCILDREERSLNWVSVKTGISYSTLHKFCSNKTTSVSYDVLEKLCNLFNCDVCDIIENTRE